MEELNYIQCNYCLVVHVYHVITLILYDHNYYSVVMGEVFHYYNKVGAVAMKLLLFLLELETRTMLRLAL